jgi:hypothetical protein
LHFKLSNFGSKSVYLLLTFISIYAIIKIVSKEICFFGSPEKLRKCSCYNKQAANCIIAKLTNPADFFVREKVALTHVKQQQCVLFGTVKSVWLSKPEIEHTLNHQITKE